MISDDFCAHKQKFALCLKVIKQNYSQYTWFQTRDGKTWRYLTELGPPKYFKRKKNYIRISNMQCIINAYRHCADYLRQVLDS